MKIETVEIKKLVIMCVDKYNGDQGFTHPIHSAFAKEDKEIPDKLKPQGLDVCDSNNYLLFVKVMRMIHG